MARRAAAALAFVFFLSRPLWSQKPLPASPDRYVYNEGVVSSVAQEQLSRRLSGIEDKTGHQFVVALFRGSDGESIEDYSNRLFKAWGIGSKKSNDGLLFVVFKDDRKWRVEVGYGLEATLTDLEAADLVRSQAVSYFKNGDFDSGVMAAVDALESKLSATPTMAWPRGVQRSPLHFGGIILLIFGLLFLACLAYEGSKKSTIGSRGHIVGLAMSDVISLIYDLVLIFLSSRSSGGGSSGGFSGGGFSGGGGSSGGGGASGDW